MVKKKAKAKKKGNYRKVLLGVFEGEDGQYYWQARRGIRIVAIGGEGFSTRSNARKSVRAFVKAVQALKPEDTGHFKVVNIDV